MQELLELYHRNFSNNIRNEETVKDILSNPENHIIERRIDNKLIGVSIINKNTVLMLCVDEEYRHKGIGTKLLNQSEKYILEQGYDKVNVGAGYDYLMPGVPINEANISFFERRFYTHSWGNDECFDMDMELKDTICDYNLDDTVNGIRYRLATINDLEEIKKCTDDAQDSFTKYYMNTKLYDTNNDQIVLVAEDNGEICGTLIISKEIEAPNMGSVGCTTTKHNHQGRGIATTMVQIGTKYLRDLGYKYGHLGYTYTGLDKMYGKAGYKVSTKYFMAEKPLVLIKDSDFNFRKLKKRNLIDLDIHLMIQMIYGINIKL